ncbi:hypothetical protein EAS62_27615 [Bradyrhizobium zhanjiangense]|uniref:Uncharacterized protein n=1 Tax=Bradyrhizobium zhanjiangense TaxID=1325107 RepID=A0ABY0DDV0_9BRAD|nr:hypothetical protein EAS62_27615 [Bradyrhizobium zhanjiangense]
MPSSGRGLDLSRLRERSARPGDAKHRPARRVRALSSLGVSLRRHPLPNPLPRAGEGAQHRCGSNCSAPPRWCRPRRGCRGR